MYPALHHLLNSLNVIIAKLYTKNAKKTVQISKLLPKTRIACGEIWTSDRTKKTAKHQLKLFCPAIEFKRYREYVHAKFERTKNKKKMNCQRPTAPSFHPSKEPSTKALCTNRLGYCNFSRCVHLFNKIFIARFHST